MLFDTSSFDISKNTSNKAKIRSEMINGTYVGLELEGYLKEPLAIHFDAHWEPIISVDNLAGSIITRVLAGATIGIAKTGTFSSQAWNGGSYVVVEGIFRLVNGFVSGTHIGGYINRLINGKIVKVPRNENSGVTFMTQINSLLLMASPYTEKATLNPDAVNNSTASKLVKDTITNAPTTVTFETNAMKFTDMIIKSSAVEYSRELIKDTTYQPLYADVYFTLESRTVKSATEVTNALRKVS